MPCRHLSSHRASTVANGQVRAQIQVKFVVSTTVKPDKKVGLYSGKKTTSGDKQRKMIAILF